MAAAELVTCVTCGRAEMIGAKATRAVMDICENMLERWTEILQTKGTDWQWAPTYISTLRRESSAPVGPCLPRRLHDYVGSEVMTMIMPRRCKYGK